MNSLISKLKKKQTNIVLYGTGGQSERVFNYLKQNKIEISCFCQTNIEKEELFFDKKVLSYDDMKRRYDKYIIIIATIPSIAIEIIEYLRKKNEQNQIIHFCMPFKMTNELLDLNKYKNEISAMFDFFEDEESRGNFMKFINYKSTGNGIDLIKEVSGDSFFDEELLDRNLNYSFIDCGAYTGDTIVKFLQFNGLKYEEIIAIEMEEGNFNALNNLIKYAKLENIKTYNVALSDNEKEVTCYTKTGYNFFNANIYSSFNLVSSKKEKELLIDNGEKEITVKVKSTTIDKIINNENSIKSRKKIILKINAMGSDFEILKGSSFFMSKYKPIIILDYGCFPEDIFKIPTFIKKTNSKYKFYLKQKIVFGDSKTVLYCI